jgi:hypothetical protein
MNSNIFFFNNFINHNCTIKATSDFDGKFKCEREEFSVFTLVVELGLDGTVF